MGSYLYKNSVFGIPKKSFTVAQRRWRILFIMAEAQRRIRYIYNQPTAEEKIRAERSVRDSAIKQAINQVTPKGNHILQKAIMDLQLRGDLEAIRNALMDDGVSIIGIYGMGGIGKTTLARQIYYGTLNDPSSSFAHVYWVNVSKNYSIRGMQNDISRETGFDISFEDDEMRRAKILSRELTKSKFLIILDDVWNAFSLKDVGLPVHLNGSKVIVTSRSLVVCRELGCHEKIRVQLLPEYYACKLFLDNLGRSEETLPSPEISTRVVRECKGLPLAIIMVARSLRNKSDIHDWEAAYQTLRNSESIYEVLKMSYNGLKDLRVKQCFTYSSLHLQDLHESKRDALIQHLINEDIIAGTSVQEMFERGHTILNQLIESALLVDDIDDIQCVKMHDVIHDMAMRIMAGDNNDMGKSPRQFGISNADENNQWPITILDNNTEAIGTSRSLRDNSFTTARLIFLRIFLTPSMAIQAIRLLYLQVILGWTFILINLTLESLSAFLDQMSSPQRPQYALLAMTVSFVTLLVCILELVYRSRKEKAVWRKFWFYHPPPSNRPLGTFADNLGFICAASQCLFSAIQFVFYSHHEDNPIKLSIFPIILALYAVYSHSTKVDVSMGNYHSISRSSLP